MKIPQAFLYILIPPVAAAGAVLLWMGACEALSWVGGWRSLAALYEAESPGTGEDLGPCTVMMSRGLSVVSYRGSVHVRIASKGLGLEAGRLWRWGHPPLLIPWSSIDGVEDERQLVGEAVTVRVHGTKASFTVRSEPGRRLREAWRAAGGSG